MLGSKRDVGSDIEVGHVSVSVVATHFGIVDYAYTLTKREERNRSSLLAHSYSDSAASINRRARHTVVSCGLKA